MKKLMILVIMLCLAGCSSSPGNKQLDYKEGTVVYSFSGEDENIMITNGVIVLSPEDNVFKGGNLYSKHGELKALAEYAMEFYYHSNKEKDTIVISKSYDEPGEASLLIENGEGMPGITGDFLSDDYLKDIEDNLYFKLNFKDKEGNDFEYQFKLDVEKAAEVK